MSFQDRIAKTLWRGRALLAGGAAHAWSPVGGHGMNTGIRGAHNPTWKPAAVIRGEARENLLDTYSNEQRTTAQAIIDEMHYNILELTLRSLGVFAVRLLMPLGLSFEKVRRWIDFNLSELGMNYLESTLTAQQAKKDSLRAGDRVLYIAVTTNDSPIQLH